MMQETVVRSLRRMRRLRPTPISRWSREVADHGQTEVADRRIDLRVASYNIHKAVGRDGRFDPDRIVEVICQLDADVVALQEADQRFGRKAGLLDLGLLYHRTGLVPVPVKSAPQGHGWHGNVVLVRGGIVAATRQIVLPSVEPRGALIVDLTLNGVPIRIVAAHLGLIRRSRSLQVEALVAASKPADGRPIFLMGDLNEWRIGKKSSLHGLAPNFGPLHAAIPSFPARYPLWALDRIMAYPAEAIEHVELHDTPLARIASDHLPIKATVNLPASLREQTGGTGSLESGS